MRYSEHPPRVEYHLTPPQVRWALSKCEEQGTLERFDEEYPLSPEHAFLASGRPVLEFVGAGTPATVMLLDDGKLILEAETNHVCAGLNEKPKRLPEELIKSLEPFLRPPEPAD